MAESKTAVIDNGSGYLKAGFAGDDAPIITMPSCVGRPKYTKVTEEVDQTEETVLIGADAIAKRGILKLTNPVENGFVSNWADMELVFRHCLHGELRIDPSEFYALLTEAPMNAKENREHLLTMFFEVFEVLGFYVSIQAVLSLYASGRTTGNVTDSGDGVTHSVPIFEGYTLPHCMGRLDIAGRDLTKYLTLLLKAEGGPSLISSAEASIARDIKEKIGVCILDPEDPDCVGQVEPMSVITPDGNEYSFTTARWKCCEPLFDPSLIGIEAPGAHLQTFQSIRKSDMDLHMELYNNGVLSGGTTMFPGMAARMTKELVALAPPTAKIRIIAPPERKYSVWIGGSILASLSSFATMWITRTEYDDAGSNIVHRKCIS